MLGAETRPGTRHGRRLALALAAALGGGAVLAGGPLAGGAPAWSAATPRSGGTAPSGGLGGLGTSAVLARTRAALAASPTFVLDGTLREKSSSLTFSFASADEGGRARGILTSHSPSLGFTGSLRFVEIASHLYLRAGAAFWQREATAAAPSSSAALSRAVVSLLAGKWIEFSGTSAGSLRSALGSFTSPEAFANKLLSPADPGRLHEGPPTSYRGEPALPLVSPGGGGTLYVALTGSPRPLGATGGVTGAISFSYPTGLSVTAPAGARTIDQLLGAAAAPAATSTG